MVMSRVMSRVMSGALCRSSVVWTSIQNLSHSVNQPWSRYELHCNGAAQSHFGTRSLGDRNGVIGAVLSSKVMSSLESAATGRTAVGGGQIL